MQAKSFIDILANELRKEIRAEFEAELSASRVSPAQKIESAHKAEQTHLWLNLKMGGAFVGTTTRPTSAYKSERKQPAAVRQLTSAVGVKAEVKTERHGFATTMEQTLALEFFRREGAAINERFSETGLKSEFRRIALRIHPDRHVGASIEQLKSYSARFQTLVESAEVLEATLN